MNQVLVARISRLQSFALLAGVIGLIGGGIGVLTQPRQFFISYLYAYLFWLGLSLGCLCVAMIHHLTGGRWGDVTRRFLEAGYLTLPGMGLLFVPILCGIHFLYPWANKAAVAASEILKHKAHYLNVPGFIGRAIFFFLLWVLMGAYLRGKSTEQDNTADPKPTRQARTLSGPGVVLYALGVTFAWIDWLMSTEADWYSTIFPVIICGGQILSAFAFIIIMLAWFCDQPPFKPLIQPGHFHHLGNLLLTFVMFWTYVAFGQLLIIWAGNLPHEITWYLHRIAGDWKWVATILFLFNFFLPFFLLLFRSSKKNPAALCNLAALVFFCQIVNNYWMVEPAFFPEQMHFHWLDIVAPIGVGGVWLFLFGAFLKRAPFLTANDPRISYSFTHAEQ